MILKFIELSCDGCNDAVVGPVAVHEGAREVRKIAKAQGWTFILRDTNSGYRNRLDLCPACILVDAETPT